MPKKKAQKRVGKIKPAKKTEVQYRKAMLSNVDEVWKMIQTELLPILKLWKGETSLRDSYFKDGFIDDIQAALNRVEGEVNQLSGLQRAIAASFVNQSVRNHSVRFEKTVERSGINPGLKSIIKTEQLEGVLGATVSQNSKLIKSVPDQYFSRVRDAIERNYLTGEFDVKKGGLVGELRRLTGITRNRAKLIAVDQAHKLNSALNQIRSEELGSISYIWETSDDERVRGNPSGKYPNVPLARNHFVRDGKRFLWKPWSGSEKNRPIGLNGKKIPDPPKEGNPGEPINCRCTARPVF